VWHVMGARWWNETLGKASARRKDAILLLHVRVYGESSRVGAHPSKDAKATGSKAGPARAGVTAAMQQSHAAVPGASSGRSPEPSGHCS
jgi:hypothetical protein